MLSKVLSTGFTGKSPASCFSMLRTVSLMVKIWGVENFTYADYSEITVVWHYQCVNNL